MKKQAGRPTVPSELKAKNRTMRFNDLTWAQIKELGGTKWIVLKVNKEFQDVKNK
jgi:predicted DNA-binding protein (MmcQ/YjbR family)